MDFPIKMKILPALLFCFLSALLGLSSTQVIRKEGTEGQGITVICHFPFSGSRKFFCKGECKKEDILIETTEDKAYKDRYSIESQGTFGSSAVIVTIKPLTKSDTGRYKCGVGKGFMDFKLDVELTVKAAPTTSTTTSIIPTPEPAAGYFLPLVVCVPVVVLLLVAVLLFLYKKKTQRNCDGLNKSVNLNNTNMKIDPYESSAFHNCNDHAYESLNPSSRDPGPRLLYPQRHTGQMRVLGRGNGFL